MSRRCIGVFDSGVGGLSVLREIHRLMPWLDIHYIGDSAWCPYGTKSREEIRERSAKITGHFLDRNISLVVAACNSATIQAIDWLRENFSPTVEFVGMEPGVKPACAQSKTGIIGVLATEASFRGEKFTKLVERTAHGKRVIETPCPKFVELVERGILDGPEVERAVRLYVDPLLEAEADVLVLGCSHYPFLRPALEQYLPGEQILIDTGEAVARRVEEIYGVNYEKKNLGQIRIETSGSLKELDRLLPVLLPGLNCETGRLEISHD